MASGHSYRDVCEYSGPLLRLFDGLAQKRRAAELAAENLMFLDLTQAAIASCVGPEGAKAFTKVRAELARRLQPEEGAEGPGAPAKAAGVLAVLKSFKNLKR